MTPSVRALSPVLLSVVLLAASGAALAQDGDDAPAAESREDRMWRTTLEPLRAGDVVLGLGVGLGGDVTQGYAPPPNGYYPRTDVILKPGLSARWGVTDWLTLQLLEVQLTMLRGDGLLPTLTLATGFAGLGVGFSNAEGVILQSDVHVTARSVWSRRDLMWGTSLGVATAGMGHRGGWLVPNTMVHAEAQAALRLSPVATVFLTVGGQGRLTEGTFPASLGVVTASLPGLRYYVAWGTAVQIAPVFGVSLGEDRRRTFALMALDVVWMPRRW